MNKQERKQLTKDALEAFSYPYVIFDRNEGFGPGCTCFFIQTPSDEHMFVDFASTKRDWVARDAAISGKGTGRPGLVTTAGLES